MNKTSYPNINDTLISNSYNILKWTNAFHEIYSLTNYANNDFSQAFNKITDGWDPVEKTDFKHWIKFYQESGQNKYKMAQIAFENLKGTIPMPPDFVNNQDYNEQIKKNEIAKKIKSLLSRITAAERIATDPDVQSALLDIGLSKWFETLHELKRKIQLAPLKNIRSSLLEDIIIKQANILNKNGFPKAASEIAKLAQNAPAKPASPKAPEPPKQPKPTGPAAPKKEEFNLPKANPPASNKNEFKSPSGPSISPLPSLPDAAESLPEKSSGEEAINEFIEGLNLNNDVNDADISVFAQEEPLQRQLPQNIPQEPLQEPQPEIDIMEDEHLSSKPDDLIESALEKVSIHDVIAKLEIIANILRTRELPRQFAISDLMMDRLGISSFFPALAEASSKTLDANQYALTRIEDILSKLRGVVKTAPSDQIDLSGNDQVTNFLVNKLKEDQRRDQERKEQKQKDQQIAEKVLKPLETQELNRPVNIK